MDDARVVPDDVARSRARLAAVAARRRWPGDASSVDRLLAYVVDVLDRSRRVNLTGATTLPGAVEALAITALAVGDAWDGDAPPRRVVDLGSGNGLPGVAAALAWPEACVLLVERRRRKAEAVADLVARAGLERVDVVACDGRELTRRRPDVAGAVDLVLVRAFGALADAIGIAAPWLRPGGRIAHWKGRGLEADEIEAARTAACRFGLVEGPALGFDDDAGPARIVIHERPRSP